MSMRKICDRCKAEFEAVDNKNTLVREENDGKTTTYWLCDECMTAAYQWFEEGTRKS